MFIKNFYFIFDKCLTKIKKYMVNKKRKKVVIDMYKKIIREHVKYIDKQMPYYGYTKCALTDEVLTRNNSAINIYDKSFVEMWSCLVESYGKGEDKLVDYLYYNLQRSGRVFYWDDLNIIGKLISFFKQNCKYRFTTRKANMDFLKERNEIIKWTEND